MLKLLQILITDAYGKKLRYLVIFGAKRNWKGKEGISARLSLIYSIYVLVFFVVAAVFTYSVRLLFWNSVRAEFLLSRWTCDVHEAKKHYRGLQLLIARVTLMAEIAGAHSHLYARV